MSEGVVDEEAEEGADFQPPGDKSSAGECYTRPGLHVLLFTNLTLDLEGAGQEDDTPTTTGEASSSGEEEDGKTSEGMVDPVLLEAPDECLYFVASEILKETLSRLFHDPNEVETLAVQGEERCVT